MENFKCFLIIMTHRKNYLENLPSLKFISRQNFPLFLFLRNENLFLEMIQQHEKNPHKATMKSKIVFFIPHTAAIITAKRSENTTQESQKRFLLSRCAFAIIFRISRQRKKCITAACFDRENSRFSESYFTIFLHNLFSSLLWFERKIIFTLFSSRTFFSL